MPRPPRTTLWLLGLLILTSSGCGPPAPPLGSAFVPGIGFSADPEAYVARFYEESDFLSLHLDQGVPWALLGACDGDLETCPLDGSLAAARDDLVAFVAALRPHRDAFGERVLVSVNPLDGERSGLAPNHFFEVAHGVAAGPPGGDFASEAVQSTYVRWCVWVAERLEPRYFAPGIEIDMYRRHADGDEFFRLVDTLGEARDAVKAALPGRVVTVASTLQWEFFRDLWATDPQARADLGLLVAAWRSWNDDAWFVSTYPHIAAGGTEYAPRPVGVDHYDFASYGIGFGPETVFLFSEAGTPAAHQPKLLDTLVRVSVAHGGHAIVWFMLEDADGFEPALPLFFRDLGLFDDAGPVPTPNPGLFVWRLLRL